MALTCIPEPQITRYGLPVEVQDVLARAFPNSGDQVKIIEMFKDSAKNGQLGIPVRLDGGKIHVTYRAAILVSRRPKSYEVQPYFITNARLSMAAVAVPTTLFSRGWLISAGSVSG